MNTVGCCTGIRPQLNAEKLQKLLQLLRVLPTKGIPDDMPEFDEILEDVKNFLRDVDDFLSNTLKKEKLKKEANARKEVLLNELNILQSKMPPERIPEEDEEDLEEEYSTPEAVFNPEEDFVIIDQDSQDDIYDDNVNPTPMDTTVSSSDPDQTRVDEQDDNGNNINDDNRSINWDEPYGDMKITPIAAAALDAPIKTGWLEKKRKEGQIGLPGWQTRYCVMKANILYYYKKETDKKQCNSVVLTGYEGRPAAKHKKNHYMFDVVCPAKRSYTFIAKTEEDMNEWIEGIKKASTSPPDVSLAERVVTAGAVSNASSTSQENLLDNQELEETTMNTTADTDDFYDDTEVQESSTTSLEPQSSVDQDFGLTYEVVETTASDDNQIADETEELYEPVNLDEIIPTNNQEARKPLPLTPSQTTSYPRPQPTLPPPRAQPPVPRAVMNITNSMPFNNNNEPEPWDEDYDNIYIGKWDCNPDDKDELGFQRGDLLHIISREYDMHNWWVAEKHNKVGLVPKDYLMKAYVI